MTELDFLLSKKEIEFIKLAQKEGYSLEVLDTEGGKRGIIRAYKIKLFELYPNEWNPNRTTERTNQAIGESIGLFGQVVECVARIHPDIQGFQIIDGEHRFKSIVGGEDTFVSVNLLFGYSDPEVKKLTIILNETRGSADKIQLATLLSDLNTYLPTENLIVGLPYKPTELEELIDLSDVDWGNFDEDFSFEDDDDRSDDNEWISLSVKVPSTAMDVINQAKDLVSEQKELHKNKAIALGMVFECLAEEYLAGPVSSA